MAKSFYLTNVMDKLDRAALPDEIAPSGRSVDGISMQSPALRLRIIEALNYPRTLLVANMDAEDCPRNHYFNPTHQSCQWCQQGAECRWLNRNDEFSLLSQKPTEDLIGSLLFCVDYLEAHSFYADHDTRRCACETCQWVRSARKLASDYSRSRRNP